MSAWVWLNSLVWTLFCFAVNVYTWRLAYPLWRTVDRATFIALHREYMRRLDLVITLPHVLMFFTSGLGLLVRPAWFSLASAGSVFGLATTVILVSLFVAGPVHTRFTRTGVADEPGMSKLIGVSALRTVLLAVAVVGMLVPLRVRL